MSENADTSRQPIWLRFSGIELLIALTALFASFPFIESLRSGEFILSILFTGVLGSAALAIAEQGRELFIAALLALPSLIARWLNLYRPHLMPPEVFLIGGILFVLFIITKLLRSVSKAPSVTAELLCDSISAYLLLILAWTFAYWLIDEIVPNAFSFNASSGGDRSVEGFNGLYFSIITMTTVGYGDITPVSKVARMLAGMEAITGLLYVAVLIARLVAIHATSKSNAN